MATGWASGYLRCAHSGSRGVEFSGFVLAEIRGRGSLKTVCAIDGVVDLFIRKNEPVFSGIRRTTDLRLCGFRGGVLQPSHFTEFEERGGFFDLRCPFGFVGGVEGLQQREVLLDGAVEPLLVKGEEL
jgi:hypothetical protein